MLLKKQEWMRTSDSTTTIEGAITHVQGKLTEAENASVIYFADLFDAGTNNQWRIFSPAASAYYSLLPADQVINMTAKIIAAVTNTINPTLAGFTADIASLNGDVTSINSDVSTLNSSVATNATGLVNLTTDVTAATTNVASLQTQVDGLITWNVV